MNPHHQAASMSDGAAHCVSFGAAGPVVDDGTRWQFFRSDTFIGFGRALAVGLMIRLSKLSQMLK